MPKRYIRVLLLSITFAVLWSTGFLVTSIAIVSVPPFHFAALTLLTGALFVLLVFPPHISSTFAKKEALIYYATAGIIGIAVPSMLAVWKRYSYGPPYTDTIFLLILVPVFVAAYELMLRKEHSVLKAIGVGVAVIGCMAILASWERPSTFAPMARYGAIEWPLLLAAACWAFFLVIGKRSVLKFGIIETAMGSSSYAAAAGLIFALLAGSSGFKEVIDAFALESASVGTVAYAVPLLVILWLVRDESAMVAACAWLPAPIAITSITYLESAFDFSGANPLRMTSITTGMLVVVTGLIAVWWSDNSLIVKPAGKPARRLIALVLVIMAVISALFCLVAMAGPAADGYVTGELDDGSMYEHAWQIQRMETVGGYLLLAIALLLLWSGINIATGRLSYQKSLVSLIGALVLYISFTKAGGIKLINWYDWMPPDIYHTLGTEHTRMSITPVQSPSATLVGILAIASLAIAGIGALQEHRAQSTIH